VIASKSKDLIFPMPDGAATIFLKEPVAARCCDDWKPET
jgi:hypothetical protein